MNVDEPIIMLLSLIVLFTPERKDLVYTKWIERYQAHYTYLLKRYMKWRFGMIKSSYVFGKLLTKLSDLRELSDTHNQNNLHLGKSYYILCFLRFCCIMLIHNISYLGRDEVSSIQHQMQQLKLNPYPELPVVPDEFKSVNSGFDAPGSSSSRGCYEANNPSQQASSTHQFESSSVRISAPAAQNWSAASNTGKFPLQLIQQQESCAIGDQQQQQHYHHQQHHHHLQQQQNLASGDQQQQQAAQMAYQFMQIMEKSVNQIVNVPHFGLEWVTPDYQFDPLSPIIVERCPVPPEQKVVVEEPPKALTPHTMKELFDALEEFSDLVEPV